MQRLHERKLYGFKIYTDSYKNDKIEKWQIYIYVSNYLH